MYGEPIKEAGGLDKHSERLYRRVEERASIMASVVTLARTILEISAVADVLQR
jgi:hypothetical protein